MSLDKAATASTTRGPRLAFGATALVLVLALASILVLIHVFKSSGDNGETSGAGLIEPSRPALLPNSESATAPSRVPLEILPTITP